MDEKGKQLLDVASEIFLWLYIEECGGFLWRMNHDLADGRIESTPGIENDLIKIQENIVYAVGQLVRFGLKDPMGNESKEGRDIYWQWYQWWKKHIDTLSSTDLKEIGERLNKDVKDPCIEYRPLEDDSLSFSKPSNRFDLLDFEG